MIAVKPILIFTLSIRECWNILQHRDWSKDKHNHHFEGGVRLGVGTFNLLISLLPARVMRLLEFIGFSGSRVSAFFRFDVESDGGDELGNRNENVKWSIASVSNTSD